MTTLQRTMFDTPRAAEYFNARELQAQTGQPIAAFTVVALKELIDNALDAAESAGVVPSIRIVVQEADDWRQLGVSDNGGGIAPDTVARILDFTTRTSDKSLYRSPTRGAQGNALKTIVGIPHALGCRTSLVVEAQGVRHTIEAWLDPAGELRIEHDQEAVAPDMGTVVQVTLPMAGQEVWVQRWVRSFALVNPHATFTLVKSAESADGIEHAHSDPAEIRDLYQPVVDFPDAGWRKPVPTDPTSPHWYDAAAFERLVFAHIGAARRGGRDLLLRDFVRQFRGLSATSKAKTICDQFPHIAHLSDVELRPEDAARLLRTMCAQATVPQPEVLGAVGEAPFLRRFAEWYGGVERHWYRRETGVVNGIPFGFEVLVAETNEPGHLYTAVNFSPTFDDPLASTQLPSPEFTAFGLRSFLAQAHTLPSSGAWDLHHRPLSLAVHLVCPALAWLDRGKTRLRLPTAMAETIAGALWRVTKQIYHEEEQRTKDAARQERRDLSRWRAQQSAGRGMDLKSAVFAVLPEALARATGGGQYPVSARSLFYQVRPLIQQHTDKDLDYSYFSQELLTAYREQHGRIPGLYYDPRGVLYEPHSGRSVPLGTREVASYRFPAWRFNKVLYVEKKGLWPVLEQAALGERYDLAVVAAEGYANEACRVLFEHADRGQQYQIFVVHDADPHGYNIARTLREATRRMPGYRVEVTDLGLLLADALSMGLATEQFSRRKELPAGLQLNEVERQYFVGRPDGKQSWRCERVELNALSAPALVAYIEQKLKAAGALGKVIPDERDLPGLVEAAYRQQVTQEVQRVVANLLSVELLSQQVLEQFRARLTLGDARERIQEALAADPVQPWDEALARTIRLRLAEQRDDLETAVRAALVRAVTTL